MEHTPFPPAIRAAFREQYVKMGISTQEAETLFDLADNAVNKAIESLLIASDAAQAIGQGSNVLTLAVQLLVLRAEATLLAITETMRDIPGVTTATFDIKLGGAEAA